MFFLIFLKLQLSRPPVHSDCSSVSVSIQKIHYSNRYTICKSHHYFNSYKPKSKISYFCESTQPLGPLFLWQCLVFLFFPIDILHLSKELVPLFSFYFSSTRKAPNNGVLLCPFVVIQLFPHNPTIYVARAPLRLLRSLVKLYLSMWLSVCQGSVTPDH